MYNVTCFNNKVTKIIDEKCVPVVTAWCVLSLRMDERPPIKRVAANILNKQSRAGKNE